MTGRVVSADWVVPVEGEPVAGRRRRDRRRRPDRRGRAGGRARRGGALRRLRDRPGLRQLPHAPRVRGLRGLRRRPPVRPLDRPAHPAQGRRSTLDDMRAIAEVGARECLRSGVTTVGDCSFVGRRGGGGRRDGPARHRLPRGLRRGRDRRSSGSTRTRRASGRRSATASGSASRRTRRTRARSAVYAAAAALGLPDADAPRGEPGRAPVARRGRRGTGRRSPSSSSRRRARPASACSPRPGSSARTLSAAHCVHVDEEEIALLAAHGVGVAHCPRSNGFLGCGTAPLLDLLDAGIAVGIATDSPASTPSFDLFEELRTAIVAARAREQRPDALTAARALELATLGGARVLGLEHEVGSLVPGKSADLAVVSLEGSPLDPVEDPVAAVVLGGSPDRVAATLVAGEDRYRRGTSAWPDTTRAARSARSRMLR